MARALRFSVDFAKLSKSEQRHVFRVSDTTRITAQMEAVLTEEGATWSVCRWVAYGKKLQDRTVRLGIALLLRREANPRAPAHSDPESGWAWPSDPVLGVGERRFYKSPEFARLVRVGVLEDRSALNRGGVAGRGVVAHGWDRVWQSLQHTLESLDRDTFQAEVRAEAATRTKRRAKRRARLGPREREVLGHLAALKKLVVRGELTVGDLEDIAARGAGAGTDAGEMTAKSGTKGTKRRGGRDGAGRKR